MRNNFILSIFIILSININAQSNYPKFEDPINITQFQLKNGLTVILSENHETPTIMGAVVVKAGGKNDPADATGIAHYLEHMLFKGTQDLGTIDYAKEKVYLDKIDSLYEELGKSKDENTRNQIQKLINEQSIKAGEFAIPNELDIMLSEIGSTNVNAFTSNDMTVYHNSFPSNKIEEWLSLYSHRFVNPIFRLFQSELETVYEEKNRGLESPFTYAFEEFGRNFYKKHPYGQQTVIGKTEHLKNPSLKKMYEFYNTYYVANNMVLILTGDFNTEDIKPLIEQYFSVWKSGSVPTFPTYQEEDFKNNESITINATPIKAFARGYRTPKFGEYDELVLNMISNILNNDQGSGLLDELINEGKVLTVQNLYQSMEDYGASIFLVVPKLIGQSFEQANLLLDSVLFKLTTGDFSNELFEGAKNQWILDFDKSLEDDVSRTYMLANVYGNNRNWYEYVNFIKAIKTIKKEELVSVAKKYFTKNSFTLYSKMGTHKQDKLKKPGFDPVIPQNEGKHSKYYQEWKSIHSQLEPRELIQVKDLISKQTINNDIQLLSVKNPINEIFNLDFVWKAGIRQNTQLEILAEFLNNSSSQDYSLSQFKNKFYALGATLDWNVDEHEFKLSITGLDKNLPAVISILSDFLAHPILKPERIKSIAKQISLDRKLNIKEPQFLAKVLTEYVRYGEKSQYLQQPSIASIHKFTVAEFDALYQQLKNYDLEINYVGTIANQDIANQLNTLNLIKGTQNSDSYVYPSHNNNFDVYFLNNKKSIQSHIYFLGNSNKYDKSKSLLINAFNYYFGYDMSSILFQEIREFRSLAYSTYGFMKNGRSANNLDYFTSYVGCQGDKTKESAELLHQLIKDMPIKTDRKEILKNSLTNIIESSNPSFRDYIDLYETSKRRGFDDNYYIYLKEQLLNFNFEDMVDYYKKEIQPMPLKMSILGNSGRFKTSILSDYGKIKKVTEKQIFKF